MLWHYVRATLFCLVFSAVYEHFSHGVYSVWMVLLFAWPLALGVVPALVCMLRGVRVPVAVRQLWACGVMTLAMGSCLQGVLEIYGTTSGLVAWYMPTGVALLTAAIAAGVSLRFRRRCA